MWPQLLYGLCEYPLWPGGLWSCLQLSPVQTERHTQTSFEEEYSAGWFAWVCCMAVHPSRWGWSHSIGCRIGFFHRDEAEGCQIVLGVPGPLLYHSPAAPLQGCSFQTAHAGQSLCIAGENLHQTRQAVGGVLPRWRSVYLPALCNGRAQRSWHCPGCSGKERQTSKDDLLLTRFAAYECACHILTTVLAILNLDGILL